MKISHKELNIYEIENFHKKVLSEIKKVKNSFTLNFDNVQTIDLSTLQLLLTLKKECEGKNIKLKLINLNSRQIKQTLRLFNLHKALGIE